MIIKDRHNSNLTDVRITTPVGGSITLTPKEDKLQLVYLWNGIKTVYILHETKLKKLILTK